MVRALWARDVGELVGIADIVCTHCGVHEIRIIQEMLQREFNHQHRSSFRYSLSYFANCANRRFAGGMGAHFAQTGPVLGNLARASPVPVHYGRAGFSSGNFARAVYLLPHFGGAGVAFS